MGIGSGGHNSGPKSNRGYDYMFGWGTPRGDVAPIEEAPTASAPSPRMPNLGGPVQVNTSQGVTPKPNAFTETMEQKEVIPNLIQDVPANQSSGFVNSGAHVPNELIFHHTVTPTIDATKDVLRQRKLAYHYLIDRDGAIHNLVNPGLGTYHAKGYNKNTIGISFVGGGDAGPVTPAQQKAAESLGRDLRRRFPTIQTFAGHKERSHHGKSDPEGFDYVSFERNSGLMFKSQ